MKPKIVKIHLDQADDLDLIEDWDRQSHRDKSRTIKDRWRAGLQQGNNNSQLDLAAIRKVIESVLDSKLAGLNLVQAKKEIVVDLMSELDDDLLL